MQTSFRVLPGSAEVLRQPFDRTSWGEAAVPNSRKAASSMSLSLITPSFSRDLPLCRELCRSIDAFGEDGLEHLLVVPREDLDLFKPLETGRRRVLVQEDHLDARLFRLPLPTVLRLPGLPAKRLRKIWLTSSLRPVRGWLLQQVLKLSANRMTDADGFVFIDSDAVMVRPFGRDSFLRDGRLPLHRVEGAVPQGDARFSAWQDAACDLLGVPCFPFEGDSNISTVMCWRRDRLEEIQARIEAVSGRPYQQALLAQPHLSEYVLYSLYCRLIAGDENGHYLQDAAICHEDWSFDMACRQSQQAFLEGLEPHHVAVLIQSTQEWPVERRRNALSQIMSAAGLSPA